MSVIYSLLGRLEAMIYSLLGRLEAMIYSLLGRLEAMPVFSYYQPLLSSSAVRLYFTTSRQHGQYVVSSGHNK